MQRFLRRPHMAGLTAGESLFGPIAQSVEQLAFNQWVEGSIPSRLTTSPIEAVSFVFYVLASHAP